MSIGEEIGFFFTALGFSLIFPVIFAFRNWWDTREGKLGSEEFFRDIEKRIDKLHWLVWLGVAIFVGIYIWRFIAGYNVLYP